MTNPTLRKGIPVVLRAGADIWRTATREDKDKWYAEKRAATEAAAARGEDTFLINMDCGGEPRLPPQSIYRRATAGEFTVVRARKAAPKGWHTAAGCCVLRDTDGVEWFAHRRDVHPLVEVKPTKSKAKAMVKTDMDRTIEAFVAEVQTMRDEYDRRSLPVLWDAAIAEGHTRLTDINIAWGRKYAKLMAADTRTDGCRGSVYCFVNRENGDILKAANFNAPAKHARGNATRTDRMKAVGPHGARYLR